MLSSGLRLHSFQTLKNIIPFLHTEVIIPQSFIPITWLLYTVMYVVTKKPKRTAQMHHAPSVHEQWQPGNPYALNTCRNTLMLPHQVRNN